MAISKDLEPLIFKKFSARRQPWWRLEEFGPPNLECVPTPLYCYQSAAPYPALAQTLRDYKLYHFFISYSTTGRISGMEYNATAFVGCDDQAVSIHSIKLSLISFH
jgi:hypothetical protein